MKNILLLLLIIPFFSNTMTPSQMEMAQIAKIKKERTNCEAFTDCSCTPSLYAKSLLFIKFIYDHGSEIVNSMQQPQSSMVANTAHAASIVLNVAIIGGIGFDQFKKSKYKKD